MENCQPSAPAKVLLVSWLGKMLNINEKRSYAEAT